MKMENLSQRAINERYLNACRDGDLSTIQTLYNLYLKKEPNIIKRIYQSFLSISQEYDIKPKLYIHLDRCDGLKFAAKNGHTNVLKFLTSVPEFIPKSKNKSDAFINSELSDCINYALSNKHIETVQTLLPFIVQDNNFKDKMNSVFSHSCSIGDLDTIEFMSANSLIFHEMHVHEVTVSLKPVKQGFHHACITGNLKAVKYLLESPEMNKYIDLKSFKDDIIITELEVVKYFIFELNIDRNHPFVSKIKFYPHEEMDELFEKKELYDKLDQNVKEKEQKNSNKKLKI